MSKYEERDIVRDASFDHNQEECEIANAQIAAANDAASRVIARALIKSQTDNMEAFVQVLGEELSKHALNFAIRTGDYDRAATLNIVADHLMKLDDAIANYDGAPHGETTERDLQAYWMKRNWI